MPRGRPSNGASAVPAATNTRSASTRSTRATRSSFATDAPNGVNVEVSEVDELAVEDEAPKRPRGRPSRASLLAKSSDTAVGSPASVGGSFDSSFSSRRRSTRISAVESESVSSGPTPVGESSESDYTTPGTSHLPTPVAGDQPSTSQAKSQRISIEVQLPARSLPEGQGERALRHSIYAMSSHAARRTEVGDSEDDDEFSDTSPSAVTARRLQAEEFALSDKLRTAAQFKRGLPESADRRPIKKTRVIPDSDEIDGIDMDAEIAAAAMLEEEHLGTRMDVQPPNPVEESEDNETDTDEDVPLASGRATRVLRAAQSSRPSLASRRTRQSAGPSAELEEELDLATEPEYDPDSGSELTLPSGVSSGLSSAVTSGDEAARPNRVNAISRRRRAYRQGGSQNREKRERDRLESHHPEIKTMWDDLEKMPVLKAGKAPQPQSISRQLKPFQLEGLAWMTAMEKLEWKGGLLGDEMGLGKTIQAVSLIMSDYPAKQPSLVLVPPVALMQWQSEIKSYTDGTLKTFVFHGTNQKTKGITVKELKKYDVIMMSYNSLESMYRKQEKGFKRKDGIYKEKSVIHSINFHRIILDEAHCIKTRTTMTAKACFALKTDYRWCLTGTPLQNRIGEFFSLIRFLNMRPFASYLCKQCPCSSLEWAMDDDSRCSHCKHAGMQHVSVFNQELLNPIQKFGNLGPGREAFRKLRLMTDRIMLRRLKKDHTNSMELPVKEIYVDRQFFGEEENDFANSIMTNGQRKFDTYVAQGVLLNNYANIFGLIMQMRQVADHPDLILKKNAEGGQNVLVCCICDEPAEDAVRSRCKHDFCRACVASYVRSTDEPDCPRCHISLSIDLEQPEIEQDENLVKKSSIINRIKMENWTSSSKIELLVHELHKLRSDNASHKSIIFSQFTTMLQLIEWRLRRAGITTVMLDGSMTPAQRQASIEHFMNNVDVECFLVSLKAGGVALNLTEASRVFIVDPWWNPAAEWQSADRCHRIGQTRPCTITRLCIEDSVESRMVLIQEKKTNMIHSTVNADDKAMDSLSPEDMQFLFRGS
ncbi:DNA repair protein RAD16 [Paramyrothecium foliicola]|nr:DNA repair protein RAD16 [Paramyrothecium foliicola]